MEALHGLVEVLRAHEVVGEADSRVRAELARRDHDGLLVLGDGLLVAPAEHETWHFCYNKEKTQLNNQMSDERRIILRNKTTAQTRQDVLEFSERVSHIEQRGLPAVHRFSGAQVQCARKLFHRLLITAFVCVRSR